MKELKDNVGELPKMGRPRTKPPEEVVAFHLEPLPIGTVVVGRCDVPSAGLKENTPAKVTDYREARQCPGGKLRFFYEVDNSGTCNVLIDFVSIPKTCKIL